MVEKKDFNIVFMGTPDFAVESLKKLVENKFNVVGVITAPDKPAGRGRKLRESAVKVYAKQLGLKVLQPTNLKDPEFINELKLMNAHLQIVVAFRMLPEIVWDMPVYGTFNLHASLLPNYRGAAPINWAIINGETKTGVTTFFLSHEIDTGDIIMQKEVSIAEHENGGDVHDKLMYTGSELVVKTVDQIISGNIEKVPQDKFITGTEKLKPAPKIFKEDCRIDWSLSLNEIYNHIRGLSPYPAAWTEIEFKDGTQLGLKIFEVKKIVEAHSLSLGQIVTDKKTYFKVACQGGCINVLNLQLAGKKRMNVKDFLMGMQNTPDLIKVL